MHITGQKGEFIKVLASPPGYLHRKASKTVSVMTSFL
jgi:hypothetical protein